MIIAVIKPKAIHWAEVSGNEFVVGLCCGNSLAVETALFEEGSIVAWMDEPQHTCDECGVEYVTQ